MIDPKDILIYTSSTKMSCSTRVTHLPTGLRAEAHGTEYATTRREAMRLLEEKLNNANTPL